MAAALPSEEILAWAKTQPLWRQDALRRILTRSFVKSDENECLLLLKDAYGAGTSGRVAVPLDATHLPVRSTTETNLRLITLDQITNVNRLAKDAALSISPAGLTLIYGDNGSGKSGYTRILKKACRARDDEQILPCSREECRKVLQVPGLSLKKNRHRTSQSNGRMMENRRPMY
jgi:hypothetical protein